MHLTLDARAREPQTIMQVYSFLSEIPRVLQMTPIQPIVVAPHGEDLHGYVLIAESHISYHGRGADGRVHLDLFSCKPFATELARAYCIEALGLTDVISHVLPDRLDFSFLHASRVLGREAEAEAEAEAEHALT